MSTTTTTPQTIAFFGASGGSGLAALTPALAAGHTCIALCRKPSKLTDKFPPASYPNLTVVQGNAHDAAAVAKCLVHPRDPAKLVDKIIFTIGGLFKPLQLTTDDPHVCEKGIDTLLSALATARTAASSSARPQIVAVSSRGISKHGRDIPYAAYPLYHFVLAVPHRDKAILERTLASSGERYSLVRPSLLTDGASDRKVQVGIEDYHRGVESVVIGWSISREDTGRWIYENYVERERAEFADKAVSITN